MSNIIETLKKTKQSIDHFVNLDKKLYLGFIDSKHPNTKFFEFGAKFDTDDFYNGVRGLSAQEFLVRSFLAATQQFCFWYDEIDGNKRTNYTSSLVNITCVSTDTLPNIYSKMKDNIKNYSVLLREERLLLLKKAYEYIEVIEPNQYDFDWLVNYLYNFEPFHYDIFRKKANYFIIDIIRYYKFVKKDTNFDIYAYLNISDHSAYRKKFIDFVDFHLIPYHMPAIDYQIPRGLRSYSLIVFPDEIDKRLNNVVLQDSQFERLIRSVSYLALNIIHNKIRLSKHNELVNEFGLEKVSSMRYNEISIIHEEMDSNLFFERNNFAKSAHKCVTTYY